MTRRQKIGVAGILVLCVLLLGTALGWWLRGPAKGTKDLLDFIESMGPKPSTEADWKALTVEQSTQKISGFDLPVIIARNIRPLLEADELTSAQHLMVENVRTNEEKCTLIWSHKAQKALKFDWKQQRVESAKVPDRNMPFYLGPENVPSVSKYDPDIKFYTPGGSKEFFIKTSKGKKSLPWTRNSLVGESYFFKTYRYGVGLEKNSLSGHIENMVVLDLDNSDIAGFVPLPPQVGRYKPLLVIDPRSDFLLCFDLDIAWIVYVDLRPGIDQTKKPWPPPWPHPALGPWHGNDDVMAGRFTQLPEGAPVPPKPADYP